MTVQYRILWEQSLLAMAVDQTAWMFTGPPQSRASFAPTRGTASVRRQAFQTNEWARREQILE
ncbi:hypothetical protein C1C98_26680 [Pseudomonas ogarae]|uniref:Uncharacterized protein n=1 Tax=Pseudomonas ogarae (strain DSM 112162 / CECT 30235 / F113) TaxID=1114970 RepID=A0ABM6R6U9_PSEO1|nr:hypothetical protein C1C98_26680 [Pseudomonas ogarae]